jgi:hypothetical protein
MYTVANRIGRLLEIRVTAPFTVADAMQLFKQIYKTMPRDKGLSLVIADLRQLRIVDPEIIDLVANYMRMDNPYVERNAFLLPPTGALVSIQTERMLKQQGADSRRAFHTRKDAESWLGEVCSAIERARVKAFLDEQKEP